MREIGSEFSTNSAEFGQNEYLALSDYPKRYFLSGRTGLHFIAGQLATRVKSVLMPEYCCGSMVAPFAAQGLTISFYDSFCLGSVPVDAAAQAVLIMDYFGFLSEQTLEFAERCKKAGKIVIVDATQTAFSRTETYRFADYIVISCRKWLDCLCAVVYSRDGFSTAEVSKQHPAYRKSWRKAAELKKTYLETLSGDKQGFLSCYAEANYMLDEDYAAYAADPAEICLLSKADSASIRAKRRGNAAYLMETVQKMAGQFDVQLLFHEMGAEDCPLFVPILVNESKRGTVRSYLTQNNIYCPVHWPIDQRYPYQETLYHRTELSLICDQRYGQDDMKRQASVLFQALIQATE